MNLQVKLPKKSELISSPTGKKSCDITTIYSENNKIMV